MASTGHRRHNARPKEPVLKLRRSSWAVIVVAVAAAAGGALIATGVVRRSDELHPRIGATDDAAESPAPAVNRCEIAGVVRRDGKAVAARVEVRLLDLPAEARSRSDSRSSEYAQAARRQLAHLRAAPAATVQTALDGRFLVRGLAPGSYAIRAAPFDDGVVGSIFVSFLAEGESMETVLDLVPARQRLRGRVVHADGRPFAGDVLVFVRGDGVSAPKSDVEEVSTADAEGHFEVTGLPVGDASVYAVGGVGVLARGRTVSLPSNDEYVLTVEAGRSVTAGRVTSAADGTPIAGAEVLSTTRWSSDFGPQDHALADADGRFRVLVPPRKGRVAVWAPGFVETEVPFEEATPTLDVRLVRGARVHGRVLSKTDGKAMPGVRVFVTAMGWGDLYPARLDRVTVTDAAGGYEFRGLAARTYGLFARGVGLVSAELLELQSDGALVVTPTPGADRVVDLGLVRGARIVGTLLDAGGVPVRGARIRAHSRGLRHVFPDDEAFSWSFTTFNEEYASTGAGGSFVVDSLVPGLEYDVSIVARGARDPGAPTAHVLAVAGTDVRIELRLPSPRWVDVTVVEADTGTPIASASATVVALVDSKGGRDGRSFARLTGRLPNSDRAESQTDANGRARVGPLGPGRLVAFASARGFASGGEADFVDVLEGAEGVASATVRLERGRTISGRVFLPDGAPAAGAELALRAPNSPRLATPTSATTDDHGAFEFQSVGEGDHALRAVIHHNGLFTGETSVAAGTTDVALTLGKGPGPRGVVARALDAEGNPIAFATARFVTPAGREYGRYLCGSVEFDFSFASHGVPTVGTVLIEQARDWEGAPLPLGSARLEGVHPGDEVEVRLPPERSIEGRVLGPDGKGIANARVRADPYKPSSSSPQAYEEPSPMDRTEAVRTDANGAFRIGQLVGGPVWIVVRPPVPFVAPPPLDALAGDRSITIRLDAAIPVAVTILDADGRPVPGARAVVAKAGETSKFLLLLSLFSDRSSGVECTAGTDGVARPIQLDARARYVLGVRGPSSRSDLAEFLDTAWSPKDTTIRLAPGLSVSGVVRDVAGKPIAGASVYCERENELRTSVRTDADGTFEFGGLPAGTVKLIVHLFSPNVVPKSPMPRTEKSVPAGTKDVVLVLK